MTMVCKAKVIGVPASILSVLSHMHAPMRGYGDALITSHSKALHHRFRPVWHTVLYSLWLLKHWDLMHFIRWHKGIRSHTNNYSIIAKGKYELLHNFHSFNFIFFHNLYPFWFISAFFQWLISNLEGHLHLERTLWTQFGEEGQRAGALINPFFFFIIDLFA